MSMVCWVLGVTPAQISALRAEPALAPALALVAHEELRKAQVDDVIAHMPPERQAEFAARRASFEQSPAAQEMRTRVTEARTAIAALGPIEKILGLDKSWHMLHYLLTGHPHPAPSPGNLLLTGEPLGEDLGYGPARLHDQASTREFSRFLEGQDLARLLARVNLKEMTQVGIYSMPSGPGADTKHEEELREEVGFYFPRLRDYVRAMADKGNGLLVWIS